MPDGATPLTAAALAGRWRLVSWRNVAADGTETHRPLGADPVGILVYTPGGWMAGQLAAGGRPALPTADPLGGAAEDRAAAYSSYVAYYGPYEVAGDRVVHHVRNSLFPNWAGLDQVRHASLTGDRLVLSTAPTELAGVTVVGELTWQREERW